MTASVHQLIPTLAGRDAIGRHTVRARAALRSAGFASDIYAGQAVGEMSGEASPYERFPGGPAGRTWLIYQCSTGSAIGPWLLERPEPFLLDYHNITPAELFEPWEPHVAVELRAGRHQLADLCAKAVAGLGDSAYNVSELESLGCARPSVAPVLFDEDDLQAKPDPEALARLRCAKAAGGADWLFVGRIAPHKAQHDVLKSFAAYTQLHDPDARLHLVGGSSSARYEAWIVEVADALGLADQVFLAGSVPQGELAALYAAADVFVCLSDHEGFCVPLLEAMHHRVPIVAYAAAAVPETLGGAGLLLPGKSPVDVAAAVHRVLTDAPLADRLRMRGAARVGVLSRSAAEATFVEAVHAAIEGR